ncbi:hypothetical protein A2814_02690 [Candidatus Nomurabacteria bacterium RIFCSPHIGHO2_01_FULL_38_19]|uniref:Uncharacterized protein n=1 Tax=Candidatus Nomurabacteria bacterium RIFCSPHIGHO2_01_FULL_38_19 TaxID=1801732 RepID=A0A1F6UQV3_9BACT|nr:MAG: hypothetical protein A2814_02690 [Candidatus Nomurabacteria bacterium RIFCSPHIGHO2_01_FULL_38_19]
MIYFILILFFVSLISIVFMIGRKMVLIKNGQSFVQEEFSFEIPYLKEIKILTSENIKKYEHLSLVLILRFYVRAINFSKNKYAEVKNKIRNRINQSQTSGERPEVSKFLKMISNYKHRIKEIKHKIKEEENT